MPRAGKSRLVDPELKLVLTNIAKPFVICLLAGVPPALIAWIMNKSAGRPLYNGYVVSKYLAVLVAAGATFFTIQKQHMDYPFWQPLLGGFLAYLIWNAQVPLFKRQKEAWEDEQRIYQGRKDKLNI